MAPLQSKCWKQKILVIPATTQNFAQPLALIDWVKMEKVAPVDRKAWTFGEKRGISIRGCLGRDWFGKGDCLPSCTLLLAPGCLPTCIACLPAWGRCLLALGRGWALLTPGPQALLFFPFLSFPDWNFLVIHMVCSLLSWIIPRQYCIKNLSSAHFFPVDI